MSVSSVRAPSTVIPVLNAAQFTRSIAIALLYSTVYKFNKTSNNRSNNMMILFITVSENFVNGSRQFIAVETFVTLGVLVKDFQQIVLH